MPAADGGPDGPLTDAEIAGLLDPCRGPATLLLAVSGGPDSLGMLAAVARWTRLADRTPAVHVASVDHALRPESADECARVQQAASALGLPSAVLRWQGEKPSTGLQEAARAARYRLLAQQAGRIGADAIMLAHHLEDQAETVLMRLVRGSGPLGLKGMASTSERDGLRLLRPFLWVPKARLAATAEFAGLQPVHDPSNDDERFTRVRLRRLMPLLAAEGLDAERLAILAGRMRMLDAAVTHHAARLAEATAEPVGPAGVTTFAGASWLDEPFAVVLRLVADAVAAAGDPAADPRLEALEELTGEVLMAIARGEPFRRNLQGALVSVSGDARVTVAREPARRTIRINDGSG